MPDTFPDDPLDTRLREALAARAEPATDVDFAARVMAAARTAERRTTESPRRPAAWPVWAAAVGVFVMIGVAVWRLAQTASWQATDGTFAQSAGDTPAALLPVGGAVFCLAVVWTIAWSALSGVDRADTPAAV